MYHFTSKKALFGILESKRLWLINLKRMDDLSDRYYGLIFTITELCKMKDNEYVEPFFNNLSQSEMLEIFEKSTEKNIYSMSFCENLDNEHLWKNYAPGSDGVCIEFNEIKLQEYFKSTFDKEYLSIDGEDYAAADNEYENIIKFIEVQYQTEEIRKKMVKKLLNIFKEGQEKVLISTLSSIDLNHEFRNLLETLYEETGGVYKSQKYCKEKEIRLVFIDYYEEKQIMQHPIYRLFYEERKEILKKLGLESKGKKFDGEKYELDVSEIFNSELIPSIVIKNNDEEFITDLRNKLDSIGLIDTKILIKGKDYIE